MSRHFYAVYWPYGVNTFNFDHEPIGTVIPFDTVKRWEKPGEAEPPADVQAWLESMLTQHVEAVEAALDAVDGIEEVQGNPPDHVDLLYYRSQEHYDRYGRDKGDYAIVNARSREIAAILETQGIEARFRYPEDDEAGFQRLANTR